MKGKISDRLESILADESARGQLRDRLISGKGGQVTLGDKRYNVKVEVRQKLTEPARHIQRT